MDARLQADPRKFEHRQPRCGDVWGPGSPFPNAGHIHPGDPPEGLGSDLAAFFF